MSSEPNSQYRRDPLGGAWIINARERGGRPMRSESPVHSRCPFCPGNEDETPPEVHRLSKAGKENEWRLRVVPNKYPALGQWEVNDLQEKPCDEQDLFFTTLPGWGAHEVVIETPLHDSHIATRSVEEIRDLLDTYAARIVELSRDQQIKHVLPFKNHGATAGTSQDHPHSQIVAMTVLPAVVRAKLDFSRKHFSRHGSCLICDTIERESSMGERVVEMSDKFIAFCPFASRCPFEVFIAPRSHNHDFALTRDTESLALTLRSVLGRLQSLLGDPPFNLVVHSTPNLISQSDMESQYHWHIEILPRLTQHAGFEWATGFYINTKPPEEAALALRGVTV